MVTIVEVGPRDGLQSLDHFVATPRKVELVQRLIAAGLRELEVTSFAHPKVVPNLADAADLLAALPRPDGVRYRALVRTSKARSGPWPRASTSWSRS